MIQHTQSDTGTTRLFLQDNNSTPPTTSLPPQRPSREIGPYSMWNKPANPVKPSQVNSRSELKKSRRQERPENKNGPVNQP